MLKITVIIPMYNVEKYIKRCINSIINQKYNNIEIILIDDGSTDNSYNIAHNYEINDPRIKIIKKENEGVSSSRNIGIQIATGDYITFIDADDYIKKNTFYKINNIIKKQKCDIIKYGYIKKYKFLKKKYKFSIEKNKCIHKQKYCEKVYPYIFKTYDLSNIWNAVFKKDIISNIKFDINLKYGEDFKFMVQALLNSKSIYFETKCLYYYVYNNNSTINRNNKKDKIRQLIDNINCYLDIKENINNLENIDSLENLNEEIKIRTQNNIISFCTEISKKNNYKTYINEMKNIMKLENIKRVEKRYFEAFNEKVWKEVLQYKYFRNLKKYNFKQEIKKFLK